MSHPMLKIKMKIPDIRKYPEENYTLLFFGGLQPL